MQFIVFAELIGDVKTPPAPLKGPRRETEDKLDRIAEARTASLKARAAQYDITFREYDKLHKELVEKFVDQLALHNRKIARKHQLIQEQEFLDALASVRGGRYT
jgi:hypothetical protein